MPSGVSTKAGEDHCPIRIKLKFKAYETLGGFSLRDSFVGAIALEGHADLVVAGTMLHEIGHKMAMTVTGTNAAKVAPGLTAPKTVAQNGPPYPKNGNKGHVYVEHGSTGPHCAYGLSDDDKTSAVFNTAILEKKATCIMFGVIDMHDGKTRPHFCEECAEHIRARDLQDLSGK